MTVKDWLANPVSTRTYGDGKYEIQENRLGSG